MHRPEEALRFELTMAYHGPLGASILRDAEGMAQPAASSAVRDGVDLLRRQLEQMDASTHPDDKAAINEINANFSSNDADHLGLFWNMELQENMFSWLLNEPRANVVHFLRWNAARYQHHQTRLDQDLPDLQDQAISGLEKVIDYGLLPKSARNPYHQATTKWKLIALDSFEAGKHLCAGYCELGEPILGLANHYRGGDDGLETMTPTGQRVYIHEGLHALRSHINAGLARLTLHSKPESTIWWDELFVEHWAQVAMHGQPDTLAPSERSRDYGSYRSLRDLGDIVLRDTISLDLVGDAFMESFDGHTFKARTALDIKLRKNYGEFAIALGIPEGGHVVNAIAQALDAVPTTMATDIAEEWQTKLAAIAA